MKPVQGLKDALRDMAPDLARALGGPLAESAVRAAARVLLGEDSADPEVLAAAVRGASPEDQVRLREASLAFRRAALDAANEGQRIAADDRADARAREIALQGRFPGLLAFTVVGGFFSVLAVMLMTGGPKGAETQFSIMLGALATMAAAVMNYYFGSSAGSREKTHLITKR